MKKKLSILFLCFVLVFANMMPVYASGDISSVTEEAGDQQAAETVQGSVTKVNPVYEGLLTEGDLLTAEDAEAPIMMLSETESYTTAQEAGLYLREQMKNRVQTVVIPYTEALDFDAADDAAFDAYLEELQTEILAVAMSHTGNPEEGDFLRFQYGGSTCSVSASYSNGQWYITDCTFVVTYYTTLEQEEGLTAKVDQLVADLDLANLSDYEQVKAIYDYVCQNVEYDYTNLNNDDYKLKYTAYAALLNGTSVCQGYANLMYRLLLEAGLDVRIVSGTSDGENHAWNIVKLGGYYYNLDATWDATRAQAGQEYAYFLKCDDSYTDHVRDEKYIEDAFDENYPMAAYDYVLGDDSGYGDSEYRDQVTEAGSLLLDKPVSVVINEAHESVLYSFTPVVSGDYGFYSIDSLDAKASLYKGNPNGAVYTKLDENDDESDSSLNFFVSATLQAGVAYYLEVSSYNEESYQVTVEKLKPTESISIYGGDSISVYAGTTDWLSYTLSPLHCMDESVFWTSSDESIVEIDNAGYYQCLKAGTVTITATTESGQSDTLQMTVIDTSLAPTLTLDKSEELTISETGAAKMYQYTPETTGIYAFYSSGSVLGTVNLYDENMGWLTSDSYSGVDGNFLLMEELKAGKTYYFEVEGEGTAGDSYNVVLTAPQFSVLSLADQKSGTVTVAEGYDYYMFTGSEGKDYDVFLETTDNTNVSCTYRYYDNVYYIAVIGSNTEDQEYKILVDELVAATDIKVSFSEDAGNYIDSFVGYVTDTGRFYGFYEPYNAQFEYYSWTSSDSEVVEVDVPGYFTLVKKGTATLTVTSENGLTKEITVTVLDKSDAETLVPGTTKNTTLNANCEHVFYQFTPDETGLYVFTAKNGTDDYIVLYDSEDEIVDSVDNANPLNMKLLEAGQTYYLDVGSYEDVVHSVDVCVEKLTVTDLTTIGEIKNQSITQGEEHYYSYKKEPGNSYYPEWEDHNGAVEVDTFYTDDVYYMKVTCPYGAEDTYSLKVIVEVPATGIEIQEGDALTEYVGTELQLNVNLLPENAIWETMTWTSSDSEVVAVEDGYCELKKAGTATVTVECESGFTDSIEITVKEMIYTALTIDEVMAGTSTSQSEKYGYSFTAPEAGTYMVMLVDNEHAADVRVFNDSMDYSTSALIFDKQVDLEKGETVYFTVQFHDDVEASYKVKVIELEPATEVVIKNGSTTGYVGLDMYLRTVFNPSGAAEESVTWSSDNTAVATVDDEGCVTFLDAGTVTITATSENDLTDSITITVKPIDYQNLPLETTMSGTLTSMEDIVGYTFTALKDGIYRVSFVSDEHVEFNLWNPDGYRMINSGSIITHEEEMKAGEVWKFAFIPSTETVSYDIIVEELVKATGVSIPAGDTADAYVGDKAILEAVFAPNNAIAEDVTWTSSDDSIAKIDEDSVHFASEGTVVLTATSDSGLTDSVTVTVYDIDTDVFKEIKANEDVTVTIDLGEASDYYMFVPERTGFYSFYSSNDSDLDPYGYLLDDQFNQIEENDDYWNLDFVFVHWLEAGKTYYFKTTSWGADTGDYTLRVENVETITIDQQISDTAEMCKPYIYAFQVPCEGRYEVVMDVDQYMEFEIAYDDSYCITTEDPRVDFIEWTAGEWICFIGLMPEDTGDFTFSVRPASDVTHDTELKNVKEATCTAEGYTGDQICKDCGTTVSKGTVVAKKAHDTELKNAKAATCEAEGYTGDQICKNCGTTVSKGTAIAKKAHTWDMGLITKEPTLAKLGVKTYACTACKTTKTEDVEFAGLVRISGDNRYQTSLAIADQLKEVLGIAKFDTIIIASGTNFPDALAGSYLAAEKNAPILMTDGMSNLEELYAYIDQNFSSKGQIYILGGTVAVSDNVYNTLKSKGYKVERLMGSDRYNTNIEILKEAGTKGKEILVCTGKGFADSLSASAADLPILLVDGEGTLTQKQKAYLSTIKGSKFCIVGGTAAVRASIEKELKAYGTVDRVSGEDRYDTSIAFAERYFKSPDTAIIAYAWNHPDGLCGGPLAAKLQAPLLLTGADKTNGKNPTTAQEATAAFAAEKYVNTYKIKKGVVLGGTGVLSDYTVNVVFDLK